MNDYPDNVATPNQQKRGFILAATDRKKHSHRCPRCNNAVYCYKAKCTLPQKLTEPCRYCRP